MKTWISFLLPEDEYKEKKILHFFAEGAILLFLALIVSLICSRFINFDTETILFLHIALFAVYVLGRYVLSGIEFTAIATEREYKKERKVIVIKSAGFVVIFIFGYSFLSGFPSSLSEWLNILAVPLLAGMFLFFINYISLKRSYHKNKELT